LRSDNAMAFPLIACHECDLLQREIDLPAGAIAKCVRCAAVLYRNRPESIERALAFAASAAVFFVLANVFPLVGLEINGELIETTLFGAARALYAGEMRTLGAVVLITTVVAPLIELVAMIGLLLPLCRNRLPRGAASVFRALRAVQPWRMPEVMLIGVFVALVKLAHLAEVIPGIALFSLAAFMTLLAACVATFDPRLLWAKLDALR
jgi:paraquat-inducible protein A